MSRILQVFCILFSAGLLSLGIANDLYRFGNPLFGIISLIPFYFVYSSAKSYKEMAFSFALHAIIVHLISSYWLAFFKDFAILTLGCSAFGTGIIAFVAGLFMYLPFSADTRASFLEAHSRQDKAGRVSLKIIWFAATYVLYEWLKSSGFIGYPWGTLYSTMFNCKLFIQIADITGTAGISFLTAIFAALLGEGIEIYFCSKKIPHIHHYAGQYARTAIFCGMLFVISFVYGTVKLLQPDRPEKYLNAILVQQNADPWTQKTDDDTIRLSQKLTEEKLEEAKENNIPIDLVVWSEGCLKYAYPIAEQHYKNYPIGKSVSSFINECNVPFILGGTYLNDENGIRKLYNAALLFDSNGEMRGHYAKNHLVPLAEAIPFSTIPAVSKFLKTVIHISAGFHPGDQYTLFEIQGQHPETRYLPESNIISLRNSFYRQKEIQKERPYVLISTPICYDDSFPDVCGPLVKNGSEVFINITDDSWSRTKSAEYQHFIISSFRTIEYRTSMARSCNSGYSVVLNSKGMILAEQPLFEESAIIVKIPVYKRTATFYLKFGNWLPHAIAWAAILYAIFIFIIKDRISLPYSERKKLNRIQKKIIKKAEKKRRNFDYD